MMSKEIVHRSREFLESQNKKDSFVLVVGDVAIDRFVFGSVERISPEAPVPVLNIEKTVDQLGCAANVLRNLTAIEDYFPNLSSEILSVVGQDFLGTQMVDKIQSLGAKSRATLERDPYRPTILKTRYIAGSHHQLLRVDNEKTHPISKEFELSLLNSFDERLPNAKAVILQDYAKGLLSKELTQEFIRKANALNVPVLVDPHRMSDPESYRGAWLMTPNVAEAEVLLGRSLSRGSDDQLMEQAVGELKDKFELTQVMITRSRYGLTLMNEQNEIHHFPTLARAVFDVTGAGDTLVSVLAGCVASGASLEVASVLANAAAAVVVGKVGTATATGSEIYQALGHQYSF
jgi:rfaE bifunctional protein kinase chain/domain